MQSPVGNQLLDRGLNRILGGFDILCKAIILPLIFRIYKLKQVRKLRFFASLLANFGQLALTVDDCWKECPQLFDRYGLRITVGIGDLGLVSVRLPALDRKAGD